MNLDQLFGVSVLGADAARSGPGDGEYGPLSPEQLANLDRKLTPAEQRAVDEWQAAVARAAQRAEEAKGGPKASANVTAKGATVTADQKKKPGGALAKKDPEPDFMARLKKIAETDVLGFPAWQVALAGLGTVLLGIGIYMLARRK